MALRPVLCSLALNGLFAGTLLAQDVPDPNPVPNSDGTYTYYSGQNMQWTPGQAISDASSGDEIVIMGGPSRAAANVYTEALDIDKSDLVIRPNTCSDSLAGGFDAGWDAVILRNPTEGMGDSDYVIRVGPNTQNTYIGRPPQITELANGAIILTHVFVSQDPNFEEYGTDSSVELVPMSRNSGPWPYPEHLDPNHRERLLLNQNIGTSSAPLPNTNGNRSNPNVTSRLQSGFVGPTMDVDAMNYLAFRLEARAIDTVALLSEGSQATLNTVEISTQNGFGGGIIVSGADDSSSYVNCIVRGTFTTGHELNGNPIHAVTITDGNPFFAGCMVIDNVGGPNGIVCQTGGRGTWSGCLFGGDPNFSFWDMFTMTRGVTQIRSDDEGTPNFSPVSNGIYTISGGAVPSFFSCTFSSNISRFGTVYFDSADSGDNDVVFFSGCQFEANQTVDGQWGATAYCVDPVAGRNPLIAFDQCEFRGANAAGTTGGATHIQHDVKSNYFPRYRVLRDITTDVIASGVFGSAGVGNAGDGSDDSIAADPADVNGDGVVDGTDLALVLSAWD